MMLLGDGIIASSKVRSYSSTSCGPLAYVSLLRPADSPPYQPSVEPPSYQLCEAEKCLK